MKLILSVLSRLGIVSRSWWMRDGKRVYGWRVGPRRKRSASAPHANKKQMEIPCE